MTARTSGVSATVAAVATTVVTVLPVFLVGGQAVQIGQSIGLTETILGVVAASYWSASALFSGAAGTLADRVGSRTGMLWAIGLAGLSAAGTVLLTPSWGWLVVWMVLAGVANAIGHPPSNALLVDRVTRSRALAFGIKQAAIPAATLAAGAAVPIFGLSVGWRWSFVALLVVALIAAILVVMFVARSPRRARASGGRRSASDLVLPRPLRRFLRLVTWASFFGAAQASAIGTFTVVSASSVGIAPAAAAGILVLGSVAGVVSRPLVGVAADRGIGGSLGTVALMMGLGAVGLVGMALGLPLTFALGCVLGFGFGWGWNGLVHYVVSRRSHPFTAQATGLVQRGAYAGSAVGPLAFGFLLTVVGSGWSWAIAAIVAIAGAVLALVALREERGLPSSPSSSN